MNSNQHYIRTIFEGLKSEKVDIISPIDKPPVPFVPERSNLLDNNRSEFTVGTDLIEDENEDDMELLDENITERKNLKDKDKHKIYVYRFSGGTAEDILIFAGGLHRVIKGKPCTTGNMANWKDVTDKVTNLQVSRVDDNSAKIIVKRGKNKGAFAEALRKFMMS